MEGGCDYGRSNVFFFGKLGAILCLNLCFLVSWKLQIKTFIGYIPLIVFLVITAINSWRDETIGYYSHPNGSMGQMILEACSFAVLGIAIVQRFSQSIPRRWPLAMLVWNLFYMVVFYFWLLIADHWTWLHTVLITATHLLLAKFFFHQTILHTSATFDAAKAYTILGICAGVLLFVGYGTSYAEIHRSGSPKWFSWVTLGLFLAALPKLFLMMQCRIKMPRLGHNWMNWADYIAISFLLPKKTLRRIPNRDEMRMTPGYVEGDALEWIAYIQNLNLELK
ncbi:hypothetical protein JXA32_11035 [Candidatus Sumerlaeota bacterium]|nr:hypothetical protein [Candidatus Sumerlaeota bacterium]